jgi:hypothetical protein
MKAFDELCRKPHYVYQCQKFGQIVALASIPDILLFNRLDASEVLVKLSLRYDGMMAVPRHKTTHDEKISMC